MYYRLLETLRQFARERLEAGEAADAAAVRGRHTAYDLALAEEGEAGLQGPAQRAWLERLEREHENLRAAARWLGAQGEAERAAGLAGALLFFWEVRGRRRGRRAQALWAAGMLAHFDGDDAVAGAVLEESLALARALGQPRVTGTALMALGWYVTDRGDTATGRRLLEEALAAQRATGDAWGSAWTLTTLATAAAHEGDAAAARAHLTAMLELSQALGDGEHMALVLLQEIVALRAPTRPAAALRLAAAATAQRERRGRALSPAEQGGWESRLEALRATLGDAVAAAAWADGQALTLEQASAAALRSAAEDDTDTDQG